MVVVDLEGGPPVLKPEWYMDCAKLLGEWLQREHGIGMYVRMLPTITKFGEATELICSQNCTAARLLLGLRLVLLTEEKAQRVNSTSTNSRIILERKEELAKTLDAVVRSQECFLLTIDV